MSLFRKPKKNLRQRVATVDSEEEADDGKNEAGPGVQVEIKLAPVKTKPVKSAAEAKKKTSSTLSFHEDLEGNDDGMETFQIRKSSQSRRIAKRMERERRLKEQQGAAGAPPPPPPPPTAQDEVTGDETTAVAAPKPTLILNGRDAEMAGYRSDSDSDQERSDGEGIHFRQPEPLRHVLESGVIPDAAMIHAARKQRQQARELGGLADYIKVEEGADYEGGQRPAEPAQGRLVREDEHDKSDEEEADDGRVDFTVDLQKKDKQQWRQAFLAAESEDVRQESDEADDTDDEVDNWERQQLQKAIRQRQVESSFPEMSLEQSASRAAVKEGSPQPAPTPRVARAPQDLTKLAPLPSTKELQEKLRERLTLMRESQRRHANELERAQEDLKTCHVEVQRLKEDQPRLAARFHFFQVTRTYVHDLVDCASTKYGEVQALEKRWTAALARRCQTLVDRRRDDVRDEAGDCAAQADAAPTAAADKVARTAEREARRRRRRLGRNDALHKEGLSSDDEQAQCHVTSFDAEKEKVRRDGEQVFGDVHDQFSSVPAILRRFDEWRDTELDSYREAYIELFLPRLLTGVVRARFLQDAWNPLGDPSEGCYVKNSEWFQTLVQYDVRSKDANQPVVSKTVELAVLPYVTEVITTAYDPCSTTQTNRLVALVRTLIDEHPSLAVSNAGGNKAMQQLLAAVVKKLENAVDQDVFIPFHFASKSLTFVNRQFWSAAKLLRNMLHWQDLIDDTLLRTLTLDKLFRRYMLIALKSATIKNDPDTVHKLRYMAAAMPKAWLGPLAPNAVHVQPLVEVVLSLALNANSTTSAGRKQVKDVAQVLRTLGANAEAEEILTKYL